MGNRRSSGKRLAAFKAAFPHTIPILAGFLFLGMVHGVYMRVAGFAFYYSLLTAAVVFGGSLEFVLVSMLLAPFAPVTTFCMAFLIQARHLFYGIAMLDKYKGYGLKRYYLIYGMCDETFSINCTAEPPEGVDKGWFYFFVTLLNQLYWMTGSTLGGLLGEVLPFNTEGLDFVMTAMFVVIFLEQLLKEQKHYTAIIGFGSAVFCRLLFTADSFLIPTMITILIMITLFRKPIERSLS